MARPTDIAVRQLRRDELARVREIDRSERIEAVYVQRGALLEKRVGDRSSPPWDPHGHGEHSVAAQQHELEQWADAGAVALGAFHGEQLVGIGVVVPHLRPGIAQLAYLYVSDGHRAGGIGGRLSGELERIARVAGDTEVVVSATPSENTVRFYLGRGFEPTAQPLPELLELEPEDVHMSKRL